MKIICVTNRLLCENNFLEQIEKICKSNVYAIILREKDLDNENYEKLFIDCQKICKKYNISLFVNSKTDIAIKLNCKNIQLSFKDFLNNKDKLNLFDNVGVSVHSLQEALEFERGMEVWKYGCIEKTDNNEISRFARNDKRKTQNNTDNFSSFQQRSCNTTSVSAYQPIRKINIFLIVGHIFETECKKGLEPKGTKFLKDICDNVNLPVFAIGGITSKTVNQLKNINIEGVCLMSTFMKKVEWFKS